LIKNIIFDIGNVLVSVDLIKFRNSIIGEEAGEKKIDRFLKSKIFRKSIIQYETGKINTKEFVDFCVKRCGNGLNRKTFVKHFNEMLIDRPYMFRFVKNLSKKGSYKLLLLSNTNPMHWRYWLENSRFIGYFKNCALSYRIGFYKPDRRIYKFVLRKYNLEPNQTLYIDDREDNCIAAKSLGIITIRYENFHTFKTLFNEMLNHSGSKSLLKKIRLNKPKFESGFEPLYNHKSKNL